MDLLRCIAARLSDDDSIAVIVPFENRPWTDAQSLPDFGGNRNLALCGELRVRESHDSYITRVME